MAKGENIFKRKDGRWEARYIKGHDPDGKMLRQDLQGGEGKALEVQVGASHRQPPAPGRYASPICVLLRRVAASAKKRGAGVHLH